MQAQGGVVSGDTGIVMHPDGWGPSGERTPTLLISVPVLRSKYLFRCRNIPFPKTWVYLFAACYYW